MSTMEAVAAIREFFAWMGTPEARLVEDGSWDDKIEGYERHLVRQEQHGRIVDALAVIDGTDWSVEQEAAQAARTVRETLLGAM